MKSRKRRSPIYFGLRSRGQGSLGLPEPETLLRLRRLGQFSIEKPQQSIAMSIPRTSSAYILLWRSLSRTK